MVGDPGYVEFTRAAEGLGWEGDGGRFDVLPLLIDVKDHVEMRELPPDVILEVPLTHPHYPWFAELGLRWHAVPAISNMCLEIGGVCYPAAPFNGWYMGTEIGARNLADTGRYDQLPVIARRLGMDTSSDRTLWRDHTLVELNVAVLHSFAEAGVTMTDHHTEARRFMTHLEKEERSGRVCPADWSWIVPPLSGALTPVFHRYYDEVTLKPSFTHHRRGCCSRTLFVSDVVLSEIDGGVLTLTFNRPERLNAWTDALGTRYFDLLTQAEADPAVRVIVVTGAGRGFCAGADFQTLTALQDGTLEALTERRVHTFPTTIRKPIIAAVNGACAGLGMVHALVCDLVFTAAEAKWTTAFSRRGLIAEYGLAWVLPKLIGQGRALDLLLSGRTFTGRRRPDSAWPCARSPLAICRPWSATTPAIWRSTARPPRWR